MPVRKFFNKSYVSILPSHYIAPAPSTVALNARVTSGLGCGLVVSCSSTFDVRPTSCLVISFKPYVLEFLISFIEFCIRDRNIFALTNDFWIVVSSSKLISINYDWVTVNFKANFYPAVNRVLF